MAANGTERSFSAADSNDCSILKPGFQISVLIGMIGEGLLMADTYLLAPVPKRVLWT